MTRGQVSTALLLLPQHLWDLPAISSCMSTLVTYSEFRINTFIKLRVRLSSFMIMDISSSSYFVFVFLAVSNTRPVGYAYWNTPDEQWLKRCGNSNKVDTYSQHISLDFYFAQETLTKQLQTNRNSHLQQFRWNKQIFFNRSY